MSIVLVDCDGPLADFTAHLCGALTEHGYYLTPEDIRHWDLGESIPRTAMGLVSKIMRRPGFVADMPWVAEGRETVLQLRKDGHTVMVLTSPLPAAPWWVHERTTWLADVFHPDDIAFVPTSRKHLVRGELLIEDHPGTAFRWLEAHPQGHAVLVDRPWNTTKSKEWWPHARMWRAKDNEVLHHARELLR